MRADSRMKPFLMYLISVAQRASVPAVLFDESLSVNILCDGTGPLALSPYLVATQTKTEAAPESDDQD